MAERIMAGTQEGLQVWRGGGRAWEELDVGLPPGTVDAIDGPVQRPATVYASVAGEGLCRSDDGGQQLAHGLLRQRPRRHRGSHRPGGGLRGHRAHPSPPERGRRRELGGAERVAGVAVGSARQVDLSASSPSGARPAYLRLARRSRMIYVCLEHGGIVRTFDRGATLRGRERRHRLSGHPSHQQHAAGSGPMFVATARGFFRSDEPGAGWRRAENGMTRDYFHDFVFCRETRP